MFTLPKTIEYLLYLFIFLIPLQTRWIWHQGIINGGAWEYGTFSIYATEILLWIILILYFVYEIKTYKLKPITYKLNGKSIIILSMFGLMAISVLSIAWAPSKYIAFNSVFLLIQAMALFICTLRFPFNINTTAWAFSMSGFVQSIFAFTQFATQKVYASKWLGMAAQDPSMQLGESVVETGLRRYLRSYGTFSHPNILGGFFVVAILFSIFLFFHSKKRWHEIIALIFAICNIVGLTLTFSRSAYVAFAVSAVLYLVFIFLKSKTHITRKIFFTVMLLAGTLLVGIIFQSAVSPRLEIKERLEKKSLEERAIYTKESFLIIQKHFMAGAGKGNFTESVRREINEKKNPWEYQPVHNIYLLSATELGIIGLFFYSIFIIASLARTIKTKNYLGIALIMALAIIGVFDHYVWSFYSGIIIFWLIFGISQKPLTDAVPRK